MILAGIFDVNAENGKGPQLVEVTPAKKVIWVLQDWKNINDRPGGR